LLSSAYTTSRPLLLLTPPCHCVGWRCTRSWEGTQSGQPTPTDQRDVPYHVTSCSAIKPEERRRNRPMFGVRASVFPSNRYSPSSPVTLEIAKRLPTDRKQ